MSKPNYIDIHCHLDFPDFDMDREGVIAEMKKEGVWGISVGVDLETSKKCVALAEAHEHIFATVGCHPTDNEAGFDEREFEKLVAHPKVVAVGECGLDYFRPASAEASARRRQKEIFIKQIEFARTHKKPLMIHGRPGKGTMDAYEDILDILPANSAGNVHFFVGDIPIARKFLDMGFTLSFDGPVTFTREYDEVVRFVPTDRILAETDAPLAAPAPYRGRRNSPLYVKEIALALAEIRGENPEEFRRQLLDNATCVFKIKI